MSFEADLRLILGGFEAGQTRGSVGVDVFFFPLQIVFLLLG
jgi:hypothetical protein